MKYYSDKTEKVYETIEELETAEKELAEKLEAEAKAKAEAEAKHAAEVAEAKAKKEALVAERGNRAKAIEEAIKEYHQHRTEKAKELDDEYKNICTLVNDFVKDYGSFHMSYRSSDEMPEIPSLSFSRAFDNIVTNLFKNF